MKCARCNRPLKREPVHGMGPKCAQAVLGIKPKRRLFGRAQVLDERQQPLFAEAQP